MLLPALSVGGRTTSLYDLSASASTAAYVRVAWRALRLTSLRAFRGTAVGQRLLSRRSSARTKPSPTRTGHSNEGNEGRTRARRVGGGPRDQDLRLAPTPATDLAALGRDHATVVAAAVTVMEEPVGPTCHLLRVTGGHVFRLEAHCGAGCGSRAR
jgi:hypothetical protein